MRFIIGFGPVDIPPGATVDVAEDGFVRAKRTENGDLIGDEPFGRPHFRGEKLINSGDTEDLYLAKALVGHRGQSLIESIHVKVFGGNVLDNELTFDAAKPDERIGLSVENRGTVSRKFSMSLIGYAWRDDEKKEDKMNQTALSAPSPWRDRLDKLTSAISDGMRNLSAGASLASAQATALATRLAHVGAKLVVEATRSEKERAAQAEENARDWQVGLGPTVVPPLTTITVQAQPQCYFRVEQIISTGDDKDLFIQGLFVGQNSQLPTFQSPIALATYRPGTSPKLRMKVCEPAIWITFQIQNMSKEERTFACTLVGKAL